MSIERVKDYFRNSGMEQRVWEFETSSASVELAAQTLDVRPARIAKTLSFASGEGCVLVVAAGDARIDNKKFKEQFAFKARMLSPDEVVAFTGSEVGGVCPFALPETTPVYLDVSLRRFHTVFPACGSSNSAIELSGDELFRFSRAAAWVDVCKDWDESADPAIDERPHPDMPMPSDGEITLHVTSVNDADEKRGYVPMYHFDIVRISDGTKIGETDLRLGFVQNTYYGGNIGYTVLEAYRGNGYARKAMPFVFAIARAHGMPYVIISCREENIASKKTLERLNGTLLETRVPPSYSALYRDGVQDRNCIFRFDLN